MTSRKIDLSASIGRRRSGFVLLVALATFSIVSVAILTLALSMSSDAHRTFDRAQRSQLDQLLLAGASQAIEHLQQTPPKPGESWPIDLPQSLADQSVTMQSTIDGSSDPAAGIVVLHIQARIENRSAEQVLKLAKDASGWRMVKAEIPGE